MRHRKERLRKSGRDRGRERARERGERDIQTNDGSSIERRMIDDGVYEIAPVRSSLRNMIT